MSASVMGTDADRLAESFTARQLAEQLAARNRGFIHWRSRAFRAEGMLRQIAAGWFTEGGARAEARRVIDERLSAAMHGVERSPDQPRKAHRS